MPRRDYEGNSIPTTVSAQVNPTDLTASITAATGWPTGGASGKFWVTFNRGESNEERALVASRSGLTLTFSSVEDRGLDGTSAGTHAAGSSAEHTYAAVEADEANQHINDTAQDHHTQYHNTARHAAVTHTSGMLGTDSVTATQIAANAVGSSELADNAVDTAAIQDLAITAAKIANTTITGAKIANDTITATQIAADAVGASEIATDAVGTAEIAANAVTSSELADNAVDSGAIASGAIDTLAKFAAAIKPPTAQSAAPSSPSTGQMWVDTDTLEVWVWNGTVWIPPFNTAWGRIYQSVLTTNGSALGSPADSDWSSTAAVRNDRAYSLILHSRVALSALSAWHIDFTNTTDSEVVLLDEPQVGGASEVMATVSAIWLPATSGTKSFKVNVTRQSGSGTLTFSATSGSPRAFVIKDIGPR